LRLTEPAGERTGACVELRLPIEASKRSLENRVSENLLDEKSSRKNETRQNETQLAKPIGGERD